MRQDFCKVGRIRGRSDRSERGAALVEAALVIPVLLMLVFGSIEYGFLFKDASEVSSAARAGGRIAAAEPKDPAMMLDTATAVATALRGFPTSPAPEVWVYQAGPNGFPVGASSFASGCGTNCVSYQLQWDTGSGGFFRAAYTGGTWPISTQNVCPGATPANWTRVGVYVKVAHQRLIPTLIPAPSILTDSAVFRLEAVEGAKCAS